MKETAANPCGSSNLFGDFNGDGKMDLLMHKYRFPAQGDYTPDDKWRIYLGQGDKTFSLAYEGSLEKGFKQFLVGDFDGDGDDDVLMRVWKKYTETIQVPCSGTQSGTAQINKTGGANTLQTRKNALQGAQPFNIPPEDGTCPESFTWWQNDLLFYSFSGGGMAHDPSKDKVGNGEENDVIYTVDLDGDGGPEFLYLAPDMTFNWVSKLNVGATEYFTAPDFVRFIDFNGNGKTDIMVVKGGNTKIFEYNGSSLATIFNSDGLFDTWHERRIFAGDFNGDRLTDFLSYDKDNKWYRYMGNGKAFAKVRLTGLEGDLKDDTGLNYGYQVSDMNGDGVSDILEMKTIWVNGVSSQELISLYKNYNLNFEKESHLVDNMTDNIKFAHFFDINGDGVNELILKQLASSPFKVFSFDLNEPRFVGSVSNGLGLRTKFIYADYHLRGIFYNSDREIITDFSSYNVNMKVVQAIEHYSPSKRISRQAYTYNGATVHRGGKGFLGFEQIKVDDYYTGTEITNNFTFKHMANSRAYYFPALHESIKKVGGSLVETTTIDYGLKTYSSGKAFFAYAKNKTTVDNLTNTTVTQGFVYDGSGNLTSSAAQYGSDGSVTVTNTYIQLASLKATRLFSTKTEKKYRSEPVFSTSVTCSYDQHGNLTKTTGQGVTTDYTVDRYGNRLTEKVSGAGIVAATTSMGYDPKGRFPVKLTNPSGQSEGMAYDLMGHQLSHKGIDGNTSYYAYDPFGNLIKTTSPDGQVTNYSLRWAGSNNFDALYYAHTTASGSAYQQTYYDILGREVKAQTDSYNGKMVVDKAYNDKGQLIKETYPYLASQGGASAPYSSYNYDKYGRLTTTTSNGLTTSVSYTGKTVSTTLPSGETLKKTSDSFGQVVSASDAGGTITYDYFSHGGVKKITAPGSSFSMAYDDNGYQKTLNDPDAGLISYVHNPVGQLMSQASPKGETSMAYDGQGRVLTETTPDGTYTYHYVSSGNGIGQVDKITKDNIEYESYGYDTYGRVTSFTGKAGDIYLTARYEYDGNGRLSKVHYPEGFGLAYHYDNIGTLTEIYTTANKLVWKLGSVNSDGQISSYSYGNGLSTTLSYDGAHKNISGIATGSIQDLTYNFNASKGQLTSRKGMINSVQETFSYDGQNQLTGVSSAMASLNQQIKYNNAVVGNIAHKSGIGNYFYGTGAGPHALTSIESTSLGEINAAPQTISYTWFNKVKEIQENDYLVDFTYAHSQQRSVMEVKKSGATERKVYYFGAYEKHVEGTATRHLYYISAPTGLAAICKKEGASEELYYVHTDHLGSVHAVTGQDKTVKGRYYYDAWGLCKELSLTGTTFSTTGNLAWLNRGYTGHELIKEINLINMNGRVYDPVVGRFLSPDPYVQAPDVTGNFNRYAYCLNNPLIYTDPSGEFIFTLATLIAAPFTGGASLSLLPMAIGADFGVWQGGSLANGTMNPTDWDYSSGKTWGYMLGGAAVGAASGYVGGAVAAADIPMANTLGIAGASLTNSVGTFMYTGGQTDISVSFGLGTYNFSNNTWDGIWNWNENSNLENIGYTFGALANIQDLAALNMGGPVDYNSLKHPTGHGSLTNPNGTIDISKGFESGNILWGGKGMKWGTAPVNELFPRIRINNVNENFLEWMTGNISLATDKGLLGISEASYGLIGNTCASQVSRALTYAGVLGLNPFTIHPSSLYLQLLARQAGIYSSSYLYQMPNN